MRIAIIVISCLLWLWFLGCTFTWKFGKVLLVEGTGLNSIELRHLYYLLSASDAFSCGNRLASGFSWLNLLCGLSHNSSVMNTLPSLVSVPGSGRDTMSALMEQLSCFQ